MSAAEAPAAAPVAEPVVETVTPPPVVAPAAPVIIEKVEPAIVDEGDDEEAILDEFRDFLDDVSPDDFAS